MTKPQDAIVIEWIDSGREPQCPPDPRYPNGCDLDAAAPGERSCKVDLPYPARRCGYYRVTCKACGTRMRVMTAGRPDDPRSVKVPCSGGNERVVN